MNLVRHRRIRSLALALLIAPLVGVCPLVAETIVSVGTHCADAPADQTAPRALVACCLVDRQLPGYTQTGTPSFGLTPLPGWTTPDRSSFDHLALLATDPRTAGATVPRFLMTAALLI